MAKAAGEIAKTINIEVQKCGLNASEVITKGDIVSFDASGEIIQSTAAKTIYEGFGIALETKTGGGSDGAESVNVAVGNTYVYVLAGGNIFAYNLVKWSSLTKVAAHAAPALVAGSTPTSAEVDAVNNGLRKIIGRYVGKETDTTVISDAVDGDTIIVRLGL